MDFRLKVFTHNVYWISLILLTIICFPKDTGAFLKFSTALRYLEVISVIWSVNWFIRRKIYDNKYYWAIWAFIIWSLVCTVLNDYENLKDALMLGYRLFSTVVLTDMLFRVSRSKAMIGISTVWSIFMIINCITLIIGGIGTKWSMITGSEVIYFFGSRVEIDQYIIYCFAFSMLASFYANTYYKILVALVVFCGCYFSVMEKVSTSLVGICMFFIVLIFSKFINNRLFWRVLLVSCVIALLYITIERDFEAFAWFLSDVIGEDITLNGRTIIWFQAINQMIGNNWVVGHGYNPMDAFWIGDYSVSHPHNQYLQILYNYGIPGLGIYLYILYMMILRIKYIEDKKIRIIHLGCIAANLLMCLVSRNFMYFTAQIYYVMTYYFDKLQSARTAKLRIIK